MSAEEANQEKLSEKEQEKRLIAKLESNSEAVVIKALEDTKHVGTPAMLKSIMSIVKREDWLEGKSKALEVLSSLKDEEAIDRYFKLIHEKEFQDYTASYISAIWLAGMDASNKVSELIALSLKSGYQAILEAFTVLDNLENNISEKQLMESQVLCKEYLDKHSEGPEVELVKTLQSTLEGMDSYE
ncbi:MAG: hypothetical protein ACPF8V_11795 [Luteibaculum sp.]